MLWSLSVFWAWAMRYIASAAPARPYWIISLPAPFSPPNPAEWPHSFDVCLKHVQGAVIFFTANHSRPPIGVKRKLTSPDGLSQKESHVRNCIEEITNRTGSWYPVANEHEEIEKWRPDKRKWSGPNPLITISVMIGTRRGRYKKPNDSGMRKLTIFFLYMLATNNPATIPQTRWYCRTGSPEWWFAHVSIFGQQRQ